MPLLPGDQLNFSPEARDRLGAFVCELLDDLENQYGTYFERLSVWRRWYEGRSVSSSLASPFEGASNIVIPYIRWQSDGVASRHINTMFAREEKIWVATSQNEEFRKQYAAPLAEFFNWAGRGNEFDLLTPVSSWISSIVPYGGEVLKLSYRKREKFLLIPGSGGKPKPQRVTIGRGPYIEHVNRDSMIWQADRPLHESQLVAHESFMTYHDMLVRVRSAGWSAEDVEASRGHTAGTGPSAQRRQKRLADRGIGTMDPSGFEPYAVTEAWVDWPMLRASGYSEIQRICDEVEEDFAVPLVVTVCRDSRKVLRAIPKPYYMPDLPFYFATYRPGDEPFAAEGLCRILEHLQRGITTITNQAIDAITIANSITGVTTDPKVASLRLSPNRFLKVDNMGDVNFPTLTKHVTPDLAFINFLIAVGERLTGMSDPSLGRETRYGGHPSPAASTMAMLQESREPLRVTGRNLRHELNRLGVDIASLYQQYGLDGGKVRRAVGAEDASRVMEWAFPTDQPLHGNLELDLRAMSDVFNPETEFQRAMVVDQLAANYYSRVLQALSVAANPQAPPPVQAAALKSVEALSSTFSRVLEAADVDEIEDFLFTLNKGTPNEAALGGLRSLAESRLGELGSNQVQPPILPAAGFAPPAPVAAGGGVGAGVNGAG